MKSAAIGGVVGLVIYGLLVFMTEAQEVSYCKDAETGKVIVVEAGYPCPYPTHKI